MKKKKQTFLWRLKHPDNKEVSYLLGTVHTKDKLAFATLPSIEEKILSCNAFAAEFDFAEANQQILMQHLKLPDGVKLSDCLKPKVYLKLEKLLGSSIIMHEHHKPFFIYNLLTESLFREDMPVALDKYLYDFAQKAGKQMGGVETFEEQMLILSKISLEDQIKLLTQVVKNFKAYKQQIIKITDLYQAGNIQKLNKAVLRSTQGLRKLMLYDRNELMAKRMKTMLAEQSTFVAVGAGHLGGQKGVLRLLKLEGVKIKPEKWKY